MDELKQLMDHHTFIMRSDRKSLFTQIKSLVQQAQEVASEELNQRRRTLKSLLEYEDKIYEIEFANNVKSRIDKDIKERKDVLLKIKEESTKNELEFLKSKRIQQYMNSCYEIREGLRHQEMQNVKECQLEQILEKERALRKEQDLEMYWKDVQQTNINLADTRQREENCLKKALVKRVTDTLNIQVEELEEKRAKERQEKLEEKHKLDALLEEIRLEEFDRKLQGKPAKVKEYRNELLKMINDKAVAREKEERERNELHRKMMAELAEIEAQETLAAKEKKKAFHKATIDFINYVRRTRELNDQQEQMFSDRVDDLRRVDICTKGNILRERQRKARIAQECYAELRKQICEQYKKKLLEEAEHREDKMIENRFVHEEVSRESILQQRRKNREDLDKQIAEIKQIREAEEANFKTTLHRASNDPVFCAELAEEYIREGIDYLEPHANWQILCPSKEFVAKDYYSLTGQGAIPKKVVAAPCCFATEQPLCGKKSKDGRGDEKKCIDDQTYRNRLY